MSPARSKKSESGVTISPVIAGLNRINSVGRRIQPQMNTDRHESGEKSPQWNFAL
jgi:hypothetical protein